VRISRGEIEEADLGLAPLIDVVLLLLIFFLVTTSFAAPRIPLELPGAASAEAPRPAELTVVLTAGSGLYLDETPVTLEELDLALDPLAPDTALELRADAAVTHGRVIRVLDLAREHGLTELGVAVTDASTARSGNASPGGRGAAESGRDAPPAASGASAEPRERETQ